MGPTVSLHICVPIHTANSDTMKILLTGTSGFLGRHLLPLLEQQGHKLYHLVRKPPQHQNETLWDFHSPIPLELPPCDAVIHLGAKVSFDSAHRTEIFSANTLSTLHICEYCRRSGSYLIFPSSIQVHGRATSIGPDTPLCPDSSYGMSKYIAEEAVRAGMEHAAILRIGGIYGVGGPAHLGLNKAITKACYTGMPPVLRGGASARRNYICVSDAAQWLVHLVNTNTTSTDRRIETLYLAGPEILTIEAWLQAIVDVLLPDNKLARDGAEEAPDCVVQGTEPPFTLTPFRTYLESLVLPDQIPVH